MPPAISNYNLILPQRPYTYNNISLGESDHLACSQPTLFQKSVCMEYLLILSLEPLSPTASDELLEFSDKRKRYNFRNNPRIGAQGQKHKYVR